MNVLDIPFKNKTGEEKNLKNYPAKAYLVVNVASKCGLTPQYEELQALYNEFHEGGLEILGFPCNQFAGQEPGSNDEIQEFCQLNYGVEFPIMDKIEVNGSGTVPLYKELKTRAKGALGTKAIKWNFTKFLISEDGTKVKRYAPTTKPYDMRGDIESVLS